MPRPTGSVENARPRALGMDRDSYAQKHGRIVGGLCRRVPLTREHAQFARNGREELLADDHGKLPASTDPYRRWMVRRMRSNWRGGDPDHRWPCPQAGIAEAKMIYLHSGADASVRYEPAG